MAADTLIKDDPTLVRFRAALAETMAPASSGLCSMVRARAAMRGRIPITTLRCFCAIWTDRGRELYRLADVGTEVLYGGGGVIMPSLSCRRLSRPHAAHVRDPPRRHRSVTPEAGNILAKPASCLTKRQPPSRQSLRMRQAARPILPGFMPHRHFFPRKVSACRKPIAGAQRIRQRVKDEPRITELQRAFLGRAYSFKAIADYETGPAAHVSPNRRKGH